MLKTSLVIACLFFSYCFISQVKPDTNTTSVLLRDTLHTDTLYKDTLLIEEIIIDKRVDALEKLEAKKEYHKEMYWRGDDKNMVTIPITGGIAINIQKVYNHFSRRGKGARRLQQTFEREYEDDLVESIWNPLLLSYTTLQGDSLAKFNLYSKPSLEFLSQASHYERVEYLLRTYQNYLDSTDVIHRRFSLEP